MREMTEFLKREYEEMERQGLTWVIKSLNGPSEPHVIVEGKPCLMLASNNYLNLANDPRLKEAAIRAIEKYGAGAGSDWSIAGTMDIHVELYRKIAEFKGTEDAITFQTGFAANAGLIPQLAGKGDLLVSDELNHGSIIDGVRLSKADRAIYPHSDMSALEKILREADRKDYRRIIILTDGVFSMDGDIAKLKDIWKLAEEYRAMVYVDDAHGEGVLGDGHGIGRHFGLEKKIHFQIGTFSKAFGSFGGMLAGSRDLIRFAYNKARTWLLSAAFPPHVAAANIAALEIVEKEPERVRKLWENTRYFKKEIESIGYDTGLSETPIIPVIIGDSKKTKELAERLYKEGIFALAIVYPMVARDKARIRNQMNSGMTRDDLDFALSVYEKLGRELKII
ncbi:MAG TPA: aminotransferase class I/II-fold pyridoxal phosphate-dependent enzyme [Thermoplasmatales archaeon]|nr:aminotransferase class I/II-fold pyridoxal phosphate-dependent enzyme [Thermoplasmatales archaeon]HEX17609.1 aminotransferase class I/II-fold pyridoxal phosphate-dependent enzyme [Thermoplasmatales archaeon]